jgi:ATP-binding cassette, subfamily B, bacterial PglK
MKDIKTFIGLLDRVSRRRVYGIGVLILLAGPAEIAGLGSIVLFLGVVANPDYIQRYSLLTTVYQWGGFENETGFITALGVAMIVAVALSNMLLAFLSYFNLKLAWSLHHRLTVRLTETYLRKDYLWYLSQNTAELSKNILGEVQEVTQGILSPGLGLISNSFRLLLLGGFLLSVDPPVALAFFSVGGVVFAVLVGVTQARLLKYGAERRNALLAMYKRASEMLSGIKELKLFHGEEYLLRHFAGGVKHLGRSEITVGLVKTIPQYLLQTLALAGTVGVALVLFRTGAANEEVFTTLGVFALGGYRMMSAGQRVFANFSSIRFRSASLENIRNELHSVEPPPVQRPLKFEKEIVLKELTFSYPEQPVPVLSKLNLTIPRHSKVAFVGTTGAGKTTLLNVLLGLLQPVSGSIEIDGCPLDKTTVSAWHRCLGYVPQDVFLLDDTILNNIAFAVPASDVDRPAAIRAAQIAQLDEFVSTELSEGYDTIVGERGARLSGGQKQRLGIARALYRQPEVLVLDEATSALDGGTESTVIDGLESESSKKTLLVVAHRLMTVRRCNLIHLLKDGALIASGSYDELMDGCEEFRALAGSSDLTDEATES